MFSHILRYNILATKGSWVLVMLVPIGCWHVALSMCVIQYYVKFLDRVAPATAGGIWYSELSEDT